MKFAVFCCLFLSSLFFGCMSEEISREKISSLLDHALQTSVNGNKPEAIKEYLAIIKIIDKIPFVTNKPRAVNKQEEIRKFIYSIFSANFSESDEIQLLKEVLGSISDLSAVNGCCENISKAYSDSQRSQSVKETFFYEAINLELRGQCDATLLTMFFSKKIKNFIEADSRDKKLSTKPLFNGKLLPIFKNNNMEWKVSVGLFANMPEELWPNTSDDIGTILLLSSNKVQVGSYVDSRATGFQTGRPAYIIVIEVKLIDIASGKITFEKQFRGEYPPSTIGVGGDSVGDSPINDVIEWIKTFSIADSDFEKNRLIAALKTNPKTEKELKRDIEASGIHTIRFNYLFNKLVIDGIIIPIAKSEGEKNAKKDTMFKLNPAKMSLLPE